MGNEAVNVYQTPESDLNVTPDSQNEACNFKRFSAWGVVGLSIITFGFYTVYWLYSRSKTLNTFHSTKVSSVLLMAFVVSFAMYIVAAGLQGVYLGNEIFSMISVVVNIVYIIIYLVVLFTLSARLKEVMAVNINPVLTLFGNAIYLQYKINVSIDEAQKKVE